jgi:pyridoxamine 5'-phosphate oxidase family protein
MMSKFTEAELEYLKTQRLGRLATVNKNGEPQIAPVTFHYNAELDAIDIGGVNTGETQKYRNVGRNGLASFLIDDVVPPWKPRGIEIRGHAQAIPEGGQALSPQYSPELIRLTPTRIIFWDLTSDSRIHTARNVEKGEG